MLLHNNRVITPSPCEPFVSTNEYTALYWTNLGLALSEQQLHALLDELGVRDELERHRRPVPSAEDALRVVHGHYSHRLSHRLQSPSK